MASITLDWNEYLKKSIEMHMAENNSITVITAVSDVAISGV